LQRLFSELTSGLETQKYFLNLSATDRKNIHARISHKPEIALCKLQVGVTFLSMPSVMTSDRHWQRLLLYSAFLLSRS